MRKVIAVVILIAFVSGFFGNPLWAQSSSDLIVGLPAVGSRVSLSAQFMPAYLKGIIVHPENPFKFDCIFYKGDQALSAHEKKLEYTKLIKYFLASLAIPDDNQWVNLSPYEKNRIIKEDFGRTEMGRDLLAQDYMLKQITASLIYPQSRLGQEFWNKIYAKAYQQFGTTNIPVNTFNKVWIVPDDAEVFEKGNMAYVVKNHLKVMLEEDYLSLNIHNGIETVVTRNKNKAHTIGSQIVREVVLPALEKEVNEGKNFALLRQIFSSVILAAWYKRTLKYSLLSKVYINRSLVKGVDQNPRNNEFIYRRYLQAFKRGVFNFIRDDIDKFSQERIPRKYFSGGSEMRIPPKAFHVYAEPSAAMLTGAEGDAANEDMAEVVVKTVYHHDADFDKSIGLEAYYHQENALNPATPITEKIVKGIHFYIAANQPFSQDNWILNFWWGVYREKEMLLGGHPDLKFPLPQEIDGQMKNFIDWLQEAEKKGIDPVKLAAMTYIRLIKIHPFLNGNGRVGRELINLILRRHGIEPVKNMTLIDWHALSHDNLDNNEQSANYLGDLLSTAMKGESVRFEVPGGLISSYSENLSGKRFYGFDMGLGKEPYRIKFSEDLGARYKTNRFLVSKGLARLIQNGENIDDLYQRLHFIEGNPEKQKAFFQWLNLKEAVLGDALFPQALKDYLDHAMRSQRAVDTLNGGIDLNSFHLTVDHGMRSASSMPLTDDIGVLNNLIGLRPFVISIEPAVGSKILMQNLK